MTRMHYAGIADATLPKAVPAERYDIRIVSAVFNEKSKSSGKPNIAVEIEIPSQPLASTMYHYLSFADGEDAKRDAIKQGMTNKFMEIFSIPYDDEGFDTEDFPGCTADNVPLLIDKDEVSGRESNKIDLFNI